MTGKHFTEDFRKEAVRLALNIALSRHQVADNLGVGHSTLGKWISAYRDDDYDEPKIISYANSQSCLMNADREQATQNAASRKPLIAIMAGRLLLICSIRILAVMVWMKNGVST